MTVSPRDDSIDRLVRRHLDREEAKVDPASVLTGVRARAARPALSFRRRVVRWSVGFVGMAAALWLLLWGLPTNTASAESLINEAKEVHSAPVDRLYRIDSQLGMNWFRQPKVLEFQRKFQLWTRGDRFYLMTGGENHQWAWGKDEKGRYWLALNAKVGLIFNADEIGDVPLTTDLYSMKLESLLGELPRGFDLKREEIPGRPGFARIIATPKPSQPNHRLREASLELDTTTKVIHKLTLKRAVRGETTVTIDYTLIDTKTLPDSDYQLAGHLDPDGTPFGPEIAPFRNGIWKRVLERRGLAP
jgi:hypothetical protein